MDKVRVALIGCGGRSGAHQNSFEKMDYVEVVAVADPVEERRLAAAKRFGCTRIYKDHTELYDNESAETIDAVVIAIEPTAHTDTETRAIEMGIPSWLRSPSPWTLPRPRRLPRWSRKRTSSPPSASRIVIWT